MSQAAHRVVSAWGAALCAVLLLAGCGGPKAEKPPYAGVKLGKPYQISGRMYVPHYDPNYDKIGTASWYGPGFHGRSTASGEIYDQEGMTAAHATLPLPSIVRVTNLDNGESALIRVNDRGPFSHERIIDLSHGAAVKLGLVAHGTAHVRVQFLDKETRDYVQGASGGTQTADAVFGPPLSDAPPSAALVESAAPVPVIPASPAIVDAPLPPLAPQDNPATSSLLPKEFATAPAPLPRETLPPPREPLPVAQEEVSPAAPFTAPAPLRVGVSPFGPPQPPLAPQERAGAVPETAASPFSAPSRPLAASVASAGGPQFFLQAGTFGEAHNAERQRARLAGFGPAGIHPMNQGGRTLYRVMLGPYARAEDAKNLLSKLASAGIADTSVIRE